MLVVVVVSFPYLVEFYFSACYLRLFYVVKRDCIYERCFLPVPNPLQEYGIFQGPLGTGIL